MTASAWLFNVITDYLLGVTGEQGNKKFPLYETHRYISNGTPCVVEIATLFNIGIYDIKYHL